MRKSLLAAAVAAASLSIPVSAQNTKAHLDALAAGYKAAFTCSGVFNAGKSVDSVNKYELAGIYSNMREALAALPEAVIDRDARTVSVTYSDVMPPRIAAWRPGLGCAQLPIGAAIEKVSALPAADLNPDPKPDAAWPVGDSAKIDASNAAKLDDVFTKAFDGETYGKGTITTAVLVSTPDALLGERYVDGYDQYTSQRTWSVAKSIAASVIGAAVHDDIVDVKAPANIEAWQSSADPRGSITLENLLHMSSGLYSNRSGSVTHSTYFGGGRVSDHATEAPMEAMPGKRWKYANNDTLLAVRSLRETLGSTDAYLRFPYEKLLYKIGMNNTNLETDWEGNFILSSQVWTTSRDLARLGILYLQNGEWQGERILPENWAEYVATPAPARKTTDRDNWGYGAQFWLLNKKTHGVPDGTYFAAGNRGQFMIVVPSKNVVIIRRGHDTIGGGRFDTPKFIRDVLDSLF